MNYLAIDTCADHLTVTVRAGDKEKTSFIADSGVKHSEQLMAEVEKVLNDVGATAGDMDVFCAVVGPGSFTGIRIGVATVKGFADALGKKVLGVTSFDTLAYNVKCGKVFAVIDANHGHSYACGYDDEKVVIKPQFIDNNSLNRLIDGVLTLSYAPIDGVKTTLADPATGLKAAVKANLDKATYCVNDLKPFYLRLSQAEEGRK